MRNGRFALSVATLLLAAAVVPPLRAADSATAPSVVGDRWPSANNLLGRTFPNWRVGRWITREPDRTGKVTILAFWRSDTGRAGHDLMTRLGSYQLQFADNLAVVAVNDEPAAVQRAFLAGDLTNFGVATDPDRAALNALAPRALPYALVLDRGGVVRWQLDADFLAKANRGDPAAPLPGILRTVMAAGTGTASGVATGAATRPALAVTTAVPTLRPAAAKLVTADPMVGKPFPPLTALPWVTAEPDCRRKLLLIDFWSTRCGPCVRNMPELRALQAQFADDLIVVGLSPESADVQRQFAAEHPVGYSLGVDSDGIGQAVGLSATPTAFVVGTDGLVRWQGVPTDPADPLTAELLRRLIAADPAVAAGRRR